MKFRKKFSMLLIVLILGNLCIIPTWGKEMHSSNERISITGKSISDNETATVRGWIQKKKTITKNYSSISSIPAAIYYEEYIDGSWWSGDLDWTGDAEKINGTNLYKATFSGYISKI